MRINELLSETQHTDEGVGQFLGKAAGAVGGAIGGVQGALKGMKDVYGQKRDRVAGVAQRNVQRGGGYRRPAPSPGGTTPTPPTAGTPPNTTAGAEDPKVLRAQAAELTQKADEIEKQQSAPAAEEPGYNTQTGVANPAMMAQNKENGNKLAPYGFNRQTGQPNPAPTTAPTPAPTTAPQDQALDLDQLKKDREAKQAAGQADQQQAQQQMAATQQANAATNQQDAEIKAAADAAKAKPPFQQTAADKLAIKAAADKGIREEDEIAEGFHSNFLGMIL
jgi:hypothetical protein